MQAMVAMGSHTSPGRALLPLDASWLRRAHTAYVRQRARERATHSTGDDGTGSNVSTDSNDDADGSVMLCLRDATAGFGGTADIDPLAVRKLGADKARFATPASLLPSQPMQYLPRVGLILRGGRRRILNQKQLLRCKCCAAAPQATFEGIQFDGMSFGQQVAAVVASVLVGCKALV